MPIVVDTDADDRQLGIYCGKPSEIRGSTAVMGYLEHVGLYRTQISLRRALDIAGHEHL